MRFQITAYHSPHPLTSTSMILNLNWPSLDILLFLNTGALWDWVQKPTQHFKRLSPKWEYGSIIIFTSWVLLIFSCPISAIYSKWWDTLMSEIQAPKSNIFYLQSYLESRETMKTFKQNNIFSFVFFLNTPIMWHTIATKRTFKFQSISTEIGQLFGLIMDQSSQISTVFVLRDSKIEARRNHKIIL